jgi:Transposase
VDRSIQRSSSRPVVDRERRPIVRSYVITHGTFLIGSLGNYLIADTTAARNLRGREQCDLPAPHTFVRGLRADQPAVVAGLSMPYSNDPIEGANTKVKLLKRQMYRRAGFPVLRQRILLS